MTSLEVSQHFGDGPAQPLHILAVFRVSRDEIEPTHLANPHVDATHAQADVTILDSPFDSERLKWLSNCSLG